MTPRSTVSIVIPTRDRPGLLKIAVESVLLQTHPVAQIVIVDDGSSAENAVQVDALASAHRAIDLHRTTNQGVSAARNHGLKHARGEYVLFLDDDDFIHPRLCEDGIAILSRGTADAVGFGYECNLASTTAAGNPVPLRSRET
jgi:glycosyltransferase involved in cell wall biosynthesis